MITCNKKMHAILSYIGFVILTSQPVFIAGEAGVGKKILARRIHALSKRNGNFIIVNPADFGGNLFLDPLFGHTKGALTGAGKTTEGLIEKAAGGTLFIDEIGGLNYVSQLNLLRFLQEKKDLSPGLDEACETDVRVIAASNMDLWALQRSGEFCDDLNLRLRPHHIHIPPLRERMEDIPILVDHFLEKAAHELSKKKPTPSKDLINLLRTYSFPGNISELQAMVFDAVSRQTSRGLSLKTFESWILRGQEEAKQKMPVAFLNKLPTLKEIAQLLVDEAMKRSNNNMTKAAEMLGISRQAMSKRLKKKNESGE